MHREETGSKKNLQLGVVGQVNDIHSRDDAVIAMGHKRIAML